MATIDDISAAINLIDVKKEDLHKSFLHLLSQSPSSFTSTLEWADIDSYFTTLRSSTHHKFNLLQTLSPSPDTTTVPARPELKSFCQNSDGLGLMRFIATPGNRLSLLAELPDAYRCAPDAAAMVLDAMTEFYSDNASNCKSGEFRFCKKSCEIMLEGLLRAKPEVTVEVKNKAMEMAVQWNRKRVTGNSKEKLQGALELLLLVGAYGLIDRISMDEVIDCFAIVTKRRHVIDLLRLMIPANNINDLIQKLISKEMHAAAVYCSIEFQKTDEFPPLRLLEERKIMSMRSVEEIRKKGKKSQQNEVTLKEISELKLIIKCIDEYKLEYSKDGVVDLVKELDSHVLNSKGALVNNVKNNQGSIKQPATATVSKKQQKLLKPKKLKANKLSKKQKVNNFLRAAVPSKQHVTPRHQPKSPASDLLPNHLGPYQNSVSAFGPSGPYAGLSVGLYGQTRENIGYSGNPMPAGAGPSFYPAQSHPLSVYNSNGGFGYHPPYYPQ